MLSRRSALVLLAAIAAGAALPAAAVAQAQSKPAPRSGADDPAALLSGLYTIAAKDNAGGNFVNAPKQRAKYLSKSFAVLWSKAEAKTPKGEIGPIDFDPVSNSQDPDIKSFAIRLEKQDAGSATLAVTLTGSQPRDKPADGVIRYDLVRDGAQWRIDDIRGSADGQAWSVRALLAAALRN